jgi:hypothetical protein
MARRQPVDQALPPQVVAEAPVVFALAPGANANQVIDVNTPAGTKFYNKAIAALDHAFDLTPDSLTTFLSSLEHRALTTGWDFNVPGEGGNQLSMIQNYGQLSIEQVRAHVATYSGTPTRAAQNSRQLFLCIMATLTEEAKAHMILFKEQYMVNEVPSGMLLLKLVISESYIDTNATTKLLRERLSNLDKAMATLKSDINQFNSYVKVQVDALAARGQRTEDLLANLFKGYATASDRTFRSYIAKKEEDYEDGIDMEPTELMRLALNKYKSLMEKGKWNELSDEEAKIIALEAKVANRFDKLKAGQVKPKPQKGREKGAKKPRKDRPEWMIVKPKAEESKKKIVDGKEYWWCDNHAMWCRHSTEQCEFKGLGKAKAKPKPKTRPKRDENNVRLARALTAVIDDNEDEE